MNPDLPTSDDALSRLPSERRRPADAGVILYSCCCCCCCCLHTVGGAIGAAWMGNYHGKTADDLIRLAGRVPTGRPSDDRGSLPGVQWLFWSSVMIVGVLSMLVVGVMAQENFRHNPGASIGDLSALVVNLPLYSAGAFLMLGPVYLLAACVVMAIRVGVSPALRADPQYFRAVWGIAGRTILGTIAGIVAMVAIYVVMINIR